MVQYTSQHQLKIEEFGNLYQMGLIPPGNIPLFYTLVAMSKNALIGKLLGIFRIQKPIEGYSGPGKNKWRLSHVGGPSFSST